jgi:hypothetical protein
MPSNNASSIRLLRAQTGQKKRDENNFVGELKKLNCTNFMVPAGVTGYVQVLDGFANKKIKQLICESEKAYYDQHQNEFGNRKFSASCRRILKYFISEIFHMYTVEWSHSKPVAFKTGTH